MPASILQIQSVGIQDIYLTKNPDINLFKYNYYKYGNFAKETIKLPLNDLAGFNKKTSCIIPKKGHLLSKLYLHLKLPKLEPNNGLYASWCDTLGYAILSEPVELEIGGVVVDRCYPRFEDMWDELSNNMTGNQTGSDLMILKSDNYKSTLYNAIKEVNLLISLPFWFTKKDNMSLPILAMPSQDIKLNFKFSKFSDVVNFDGDEPDNVDILDSNVIADYFYLDEFLAKEFIEKKHTFIIDQVQYHGDELIPANNRIYNCDLKFNHPIKEMIFGLVTKDNILSNNYYVYHGENEESLLSEISLSLDGQKRYEYLDEFIFRTKFPKDVHSVIPTKYIYIIPFALKPEHNQPTGSINMSTFNDVTLSLKLKNNNPDCYIYVYAINYNVVTIEKGRLVMEFVS
jgi:hypothetical protein